MIIRDLKELLMRRAASRPGGLPFGMYNPIRLGEWVIATDGWALFALKTAEKYTHTDKGFDVAVEWIKTPLSLAIYPMKQLADFADNNEFGLINGIHFDLTILRDFLVPVEAEFYHLYLNKKEGMLFVGGEFWRVILMARKDAPLGEIHNLAIGKDQR